MSRTDSLDQRWAPDPATHDHRCDCADCHLDDGVNQDTEAWQEAENNSREAEMDRQRGWS